MKTFRKDLDEKMQNPEFRKEQRMQAAEKKKAAEDVKRILGDQITEWMKMESCYFCPSNEVYAYISPSYCSEEMFFFCEKCLGTLKRELKLLKNDLPTPE